MNRPPRTRVPPKRFRNEQQIQNINNVNLQPERKLNVNAAQKRVLTILDSIAEGKNEKIYNMLYSIYKDASKTLFTRANVFVLDDKKLVEVLEAQYKAMAKNVRSSTGGKPNILSLKLDGEDKLDFCLLVWLDMSHDGTVDTNFQDFIKSDIVKTVVGTVPQYNNDTNLMKRMRALKIIVDSKTVRVKLNTPVKVNGKLRKTKNVVYPGVWPGSGFEKLIKDNLPVLFDVQAPLKTIAGQKGLSNMATNRENQPIYISIDSEYQYKSISQLIDNSKYTFNGRNGRILRYFLKPIITLSNRVDPGRLMPAKGVTEEFAKLMQNANHLKSTQLYNVTNCNFKIGDTSLTLRTLGKGSFDLKIGKKSIPYGITAGEAKKTANNNEKLSKFLGDFMQILTVASKPVSQRIVLGTLDGVMCGMCCFISKRLMNEEPRLFIDMSFKQQNQILMYGVSDLLKASGPVKQTKSNIGSNLTRLMKEMNNTTNNANSGNSRISGNSGNSGNSKRNSKSTNNSLKKPVVSSSPRKPTSTPIQGTKRKVNNAGLNNNRRAGSGNSNSANARPGLLGRATRLFGGKKQKSNSNSTRTPNYKPQSQRRVNTNSNSNNNNTRSFVTARSNNSNNNTNNVTQPLTRKRKVNNNTRTNINKERHAMHAKAAAFLRNSAKRMKQRENEQRRRPT